MNPRFAKALAPRFSSGLMVLVVILAQLRRDRVDSRPGTCQRIGGYSLASSSRGNNSAIRQ